MMTSQWLELLAIDTVSQAIFLDPRVREQMFTAAEQAYCQGKRHAHQHYAARYLAKRLLAEGLSRLGEAPVHWQDIEVVRNTLGCPVAHIHQPLARPTAATGGRALPLSLAHGARFVVAYTILDGRDEGGQAR